jgi:hypothetical protein
MERCVKLQIRGFEYSLVYTAGVMFDAMERFPDGKIIDAIHAKGKEGAKNILWLASAMSAAGEAIRRDDGYEKGSTLKPEFWLIRLSPYEYAELKTAVVNAITQGYKRDVDDEEEVDIGLAELQKKS